VIWVYAVKTALFPRLSKFARNPRQQRTSPQSAHLRLQQQQQQQQPGGLLSASETGEQASGAAAV